MIVLSTQIDSMYFMKMMKLNCLLLLFFPLLSFSAIDERNDDYTEMSLQQLMSLEIFTAASLLPTELKKAPGTAYSFNRNDFKRLGVRRLNELLEHVPGFQLNQYRKRHRSVWSRGMIDRYNNKMKLLIDGVPIQHVYYGHFSAGENLALEKIGKVEVIIGPASSLYGANAFAGVISVTTRDFTDDSKGNTEEAYLETGIELGNHDRVKGNVFYNSKALQGFVSYLDQDAPFDDNRKSFIGGDVSQPLDEQYKNLYLKAKPVNGLQLSLDYQYSETPFVFVPDNSHINSEEKFLNLSASYEVGELETGKLETLVYYVDDKATEVEIEQNTGQMAYEEDRDSLYYGIKATWLKQLFVNHTIALGTEWQHDEAKNMNFSRNWHFTTNFLAVPKSGSLLSTDEENDDYAVFVQDVWEINNELTATIGARYDAFDKFDNDSNFRFAMVYTPTTQQTIKMLWGTAVRKPTYREYLKVLENTSFVPAMPDTEKMETFELGYSYQWQNANINITTFYNEFDDYLHEISTPDGNDEYFVNSNNTWRMHGIEMLSEYQLTSDVNLRATMGWLKAREASTGDIPYLAEWTASFLTDYRWYKSHHFVFSMLYNSDREDTNDQRFSEDEAGSFITLDVHAYGQILENVSYQLGVTNLTNEDIFDTAADFDDRYNTQRTERELWGKITYTYRF